MTGSSSTAGTSRAWSRSCSGLGRRGWLVRLLRGQTTPRNITATPDVEGRSVSTSTGRGDNTGAEAKEFAEIIRTHARRGDGRPDLRGEGRYLTPEGEETDDEAEAAVDEHGNPSRKRPDLWVTATSLTTALNTAYLAERVALFDRHGRRPAPNGDRLPGPHDQRATRAGRSRQRRRPSRQDGGPCQGDLRARWPGSPLRASCRLGTRTFGDGGPHGTQALDGDAFRPCSS